MGIFDRILRRDIKEVTLPTITETIKKEPKPKALFSKAKGIFRTKFDFFTSDKRVVSMKKWRQLYDIVPLVNSAINTYSNHAIKCGFKITGDQRPVKTIEKFIESFNFKELLLSTAKTMLIYGDAFWEKLYKNNKLVSIKQIHPETMFVIHDDYGRIESYAQRISMRKKKKLEKKIIVHFKWNTIADEIYGNSMIECIYNQTVDMLNGAYNIGVVIDRYSSPILHYKLGTENEPVTQSEIDTMSSKIETMNPDMDFVTDHRCEIAAIGVEGEALKFAPYLQHVEAQVITGLEIPEVLLYRGSTATEASSRVQFESFERNVKVLQEILSNGIEENVFKELVRGYNNIPKMEFEELSPADDVIIAQMMVALKNGGILTANEARDRIGFEKHTGDDADKLQTQKPGMDAFGKVSKDATSRDVEKNVKTPEQKKRKEALIKRYGMMLAEDIMRNMEVN